MLSSVDLDVPGTMTRDDDGGYTLTFPLIGSRWGYDDLTLPAQQVRRDAAGRRATTVRRTSRSPRRPTCSTCSRPTSRRTGSGALVEVIPTRPPLLILNVQEPLADDVRGQRNQYRLRHAAQVEEATQDSVFFRALYSEAANCNMLGVHHELGPSRHLADPLLVGARPLDPGARGRRRG